MNRFEGKVVLITGAAAGIGQATAERVAAEGGAVALLDINADGLAETARRCAAIGATAETWVCDLRDPADITRCVAEVVARLGKLDALCNVAGVLRTDHSHKLKLEDWNRVLQINLTGTFLMCQACIPHLIASRGYIVNTASTAALGSHPWMAAYAASKGGVLSMTRALSSEYIRQKVNINAVIPGGIMTSIHASFSIPDGADPQLISRASPLVRMQGPAAAASAIAFLACSDARYINGTEIRVDGGAMS